MASQLILPPGITSTLAQPTVLKSVLVPPIQTFTSIINIGIPGPPGRDGDLGEFVDFRIYFENAME